MSDQETSARLPNVYPTASHGRPDRVLDITSETCPMTFVRTRLALDALRPGQVLEVLLRGAEPRARVPATAESLGHVVIDRAERADGVLSVRLRRC